MIQADSRDDLLEAVKGMREGMVALDAGGGTKIYAKPVSARPGQTNPQTAGQPGLRFSGLPDISKN